MRALEGCGQRRAGPGSGAQGRPLAAASGRTDAGAGAGAWDLGGDHLLRQAVTGGWTRWGSQGRWGIVGFVDNLEKARGSVGGKEGT